MSLLAAAMTHTSEEEAVAESVPSPIGAAVRHIERQDLRHNVSRGKRPARIGTSEESPTPSSTPPDRGARPRPAPAMGFLESARMDREMARESSAAGYARSQNSPLSITAALLNMSNQRFVILVVGIALLTVGLLTLRSPVFLSDFDHWGFQIDCGTGFHGNFTQAAMAGSTGGRFVDQCQTAVASRRGWAIPLTATGALLLGGLIAVAPPRPRTSE